MTPGAWHTHITRNIFCTVLFVVALIFSLHEQALAGVSSAADAAAPEVEVFVHKGCPRCEEAEKFLTNLRRQRPTLQVTIRDINEQPDALARLKSLSAQSGATAPGVPSVYVRGELIVGFAGESTTGRLITALLDQRPVPAIQAETSGMSCALEEEITCKPGTAPSLESIDLPWLGITVNVEDLGLPLFTIVIGFLDGFNPCSMWALIMMTSVLAAAGERKRMLAIAGTFIAVEGIAYFAFMAAWLNLFIFVGISRISEVVLGVIGLIAGIINIKDFWAFGHGITLSIPAAAKPSIYLRLRRIVQQESILTAVAGASLLAILVQFIELLCTSGFPALYTRILTLRNFDAWTYYSYLLLYNVLYMLDDMIILAIGVITLSRRRLQENEGRWLKLLSGTVMLLLGLYLIVLHH